MSKATSKNKKGDAGGGEVSEYKKNKQDKDNYDLNQAKLDQEDEFFKKWLKQRENLGVSGAAAVLAT